MNIDTFVMGANYGDVYVGSFSYMHSFLIGNQWEPMGTEIQCDIPDQHKATVFSEQPQCT